MVVRQCAILVGGLGTRLGAIVADAPKPMLEVGGRPFLAWLLREVSRFGITDVVLLTGHLSGVVEAALPGLAAGLPREMRLRVSREPVRAGTGGALFHAAGLLDERFLLLNGDSFLDAPIGEALAVEWDVGVLGHLMLRGVADASRYGVVQLDGSTVAAFRARPEPGTPGLINGGVYVLDRGILDHIGPECSLEQDVLPALAAAGRLRGSVAAGWFIDIGIPEDLARAGRELRARLTRPALFLDRDGVCNVDHGWVGTQERFEWIEGARETIAEAGRLGWHVFIVTNQSGVARGLYDENDLRTLMRWMLDEALRAGGTIDDFRFCPFHPEAVLPAYRRVSDWRKPAPGMILDLLRAWEVEPSRCLLIGDQDSDVLAATAAGVAGHRFPGGRLDAFAGPLLQDAHRRFNETPGGTVVRESVG